MSFFAIFIDALLVHNIVLSRFLGICPFLGVSSKVGTAVGMGLAVVFVIFLSSIMTWLVYNLVLVPLDITYLSTLAFILVIAALVQFVEMVVRKKWESLYWALGIYLPLITTNCAVLGVAVINMNENYTLLQAIVHSLGASLGFLLAIVLMAGLRERLQENTNMPKALQGLPISLITAALMSIAFLGFSGLIS
ncbi:MAG: electron transport complex subunit RsxA [Aminobacterium sp.]|jgi:electron transport complex protein RnfA|uniref:electron transport complex subunit RsxA n=1 Tax=unclassified Aminobacterium TaxID=2685012 RepID=UPI001BCB04D4|nr:MULTISPECIES: electron transport complex subunit RsxA [unclassified Aminobacterium]MDD2207504.1 electron transport complex subunit RsxA [Aminobacterium sp.]MDD3426470.1 electron transport complex subunit RsxA [Aminobacterium sp.]MDD3708272.1 electron transport complex subunit RsxA [Aminobacterium sp.]MDD4229482.1 electron transport complex subunit RsxA [Aminobacterium sp.]MDD4552329.1 electron transport complex subunit RsxA [Aminobacterium sp.]